MGGADVRELFPSWAKVGRHQVELASGEPLLEDGEKVYVGYGSDFDGVPVGDADYVQARLRHKLQAARDCMDAIDAALMSKDRPQLRQAAWALHRACSSGGAFESGGGGFAEQLMPDRGNASETHRTC